MKLYSYYRSSAAYRVRIALKLKHIEFQIAPVNLLEAEHKQPEYLTINRQGLVPALELDDGRVITQSGAILQWLEAEYRDILLVPKNNFTAAKIRSVCDIIACDLHPLNNLRVLNYLEKELSVSAIKKNKWLSHWIRESFNTIESMIDSAPFCFGEEPSLADVYLVPQVFNALRFDTDMTAYPRIFQTFEYCNQLPEFVSAHPNNQQDSPNNQQEFPNNKQEFPNNQPEFPKND